MRVRVQLAFINYYAGSYLLLLQIPEDAAAHLSPGFLNGESGSERSVLSGHSYAEHVWEAGHRPSGNHVASVVLVRTQRSQPHDVLRFVDLLK